MTHECIQKNAIEDLKRQTARQNLALFGNPDDPNDLGAIELIKEIYKTQQSMMPTYEDINSWSNFFAKGKQLGAFLVAVALSGGVIVGTLYAIKQWMNK